MYISYSERMEILEAEKQNKHQECKHIPNYKERYKQMLAYEHGYKLIKKYNPTQE